MRFNFVKLFLKIIFVHFLLIGSTTSKEKDSIKLDFNWPIPSSAQIIEIHKSKFYQKEGVKFQYDIDLKNTEEGIQISQYDIKMISVDGDKSHQNLLDPSMLFSGALFPNIITSKSGEPLRALEYESYLANNSSDSNISSYLSQPQVEMMLTRTAFQTWCKWVCEWIGLDIPKNSTLKQTYQGQLYGIELPEEWIISVADIMIKEKKLIKVSINRSINTNGDKDLVKHVMASMLRSLGQDVNDKQLEKHIVNRDFIQNIKTVAILEKISNKPKHISTQIELLTLESTPNLGERITSSAFSENYEYIFSWQK